MIIQFSTAFGRYLVGVWPVLGAARGEMLPLKPDMASLTVGSNIFPTRADKNSPDLVD